MTAQKKSALRLLAVALALASGAQALFAQAPITYQYIYDSAGELTNVIDSTGVILQYVYDAAGNIVQINRGTASGSLSILSFSPTSAALGATVNIIGSGFSSTAANNTVKFNGATAAVSAATANSLTVIVPNIATTGTITVAVGANTVTSAGPFTVLAAPAITSISTPFLIAGTTGATIVVNGVNLSGSTFTALPATTPAAVTITQAVVNNNTATLTVNTGLAAVSAIIVATNGVGNSGIFASSANTVALLVGSGDADGDGLTNAQEVALGTNPLNPDTDGDGMPDGWEAHFGTNPLVNDANNLSAANDGLTNLQEYMGGTDPTNTDRTVPAVTNLSTVTNGSGTFTNSAITLAFNHALLNPTQIAALQAILAKDTNGTITVTGGGSTVIGTTAFTSNGTQLVFQPAQVLAPLTTYTVSASGFRTTAGVPMAATYMGTFATNNTADLTPPTITLFSPLPAATNVPTNSSITIEFSKKISGSTVITGINSTNPCSAPSVNGVPPYLTIMLLDQTANCYLAGKVKLDSTLRIVTFTPNSTMPVGHQIVVDLNFSGNAITDLVGNKLATPSQYVFTTGFSSNTTTGPTVTANSPLNGDSGIGANAQVMVQFSEPISEISASTGVQVTQNGNPIAGAFTFQNSDTQLTFTPSSGYSSAPVTVAITPGVTDYAGNVVSNTDSFTFTVNGTAVTTAPKVSVANPPANSTGIGRNVTIQTKFSEIINPLTVTSVAFSVTDSNNNQVIPGTLALNAARRIASFVPSAPFAANERYCFALNQNGSGTRITDLYGNLLPTYSSCFTTGSAIDTTPPTVTQVTPPNGAGGVALNSLVSVQISKPLSQVAFPGGAGGVVLPLTVGPGPEGGTAAYDAGFFPAGTSITVTAGGHGALGNTAIWQVNPDGSLFAPASSPFTYANVGATNYPVLASHGDGKNHFAGGGANIDSSNNFGFAGAATTDTANAAAIRLGTLVGTFKQQPGNLDWFVIGYGTTLTVPVGGADLYLAVNDSNNNFNTGSYPVNIAASTLAAPDITLSHAGQAITGAASLSADGMTLNFVPTSQLTPNTAYVLNIQNAADYDGNAITPFASQFSTGVSTDATSGTVVSFSPLNAATGVAVTSNVVITFSKFVDPLSVNANSITIAGANGGNGFPIAGSYSVDNTGAHAAGGIVTFTPAANLPSALAITVTLNSTANVTDFAGNSFVTPSAVTFTTAGTADTIPPVVTSVTPLNNSTNLGLNTVITLTFSKPLNSNTVNTSTIAVFNGLTRLLTNPTQISVGLSVNQQVVTINAALAQGATITVAATSGVQDLAGNALVNFQSTFTTLTLSTSSQPRVNTQRPATGAGGVPANYPILLFMSEPMNPSTINGAFNVSQNGAVVPGAIALSGNNQVIEFTPAAPFTAGATVQVFLSSSAADMNGNALQNYQATFTVAASVTTANPGIVYTSTSSSASNVPTNSPIDIQFSKPLNSATVTSANFALRLSCTGPAIGTVTLRTPTVVRIQPTSALAANQAYCFSVSTSVQDTNGLSPINFAQFNFTTGPGPDTAQPQVSSITPPNVSTGVGTNAPILIRFNKLINTATLSTSTVQITYLVNNVPTAVSPMTVTTLNLGNSTTDALFTPVGVLPDNTVINIAITNVQDIAGNNNVPYNASFTTQTGPDFSTPSVSGTSPTSFQTVPGNAVITLNFSEPMDPLTVNTSTITVTDTSTGTTTGLVLNGVWSVSPNALQATFTPEDSGGNTINLALGSSFTVTWSAINSATNLVGKGLSQASVNFSTAVSAPTTTPALVSTNPANGATGVATNAPIQILFNEPVQASSIGSVTLNLNSSPITGVVSTLAQGSTLLTLTPPSILQANASYSVTIAGVKDPSGNVLTPTVAISFTTGAGVDLAYPTITAFNPPSGYIGAGLGVNPVMQFSKPMDPVSFNSSSVFLQNANFNGTAFQNVPITFTLSTSAITLTFQPTIPLLAETQYCFHVTGVTDSVGNAVNQSECFTTGAGADSTPPVISLMDPPNGTLAAINVKPQFYASKQLNLISFNASTGLSLKTTTGGNTVTGTWTLGSDLQTITFTPAAPLASNTGYTANLAGFTDVTGNTLTPFTGQFSTNSTGVADTTPPAITTTMPTNGATGVAANSTITLNFNKPLNPLTVNAASINIYSNPPNVQIPGNYALTNGANSATVVFTPTAPVPAGSAVTVYINQSNACCVQDYAGNHATAATITFTAANAQDTTQPMVTSITPANLSANIGQNAVITLMFSKPIAQGTLTSNTIAVFDGPKELTTTIAYSNAGTSATLTPAGLTANSTIIVTATTDVQDISGNALAPSSAFPNLQMEFATGSFGTGTKPAVNAQRPANSAIGVPLKSPVTLFLSQPMDPTSTLAAIQVAQNGVLVSGTPTLDASATILTFTPTNPFAAGALIQVYLQPTAMSAAGNGLNTSIASYYSGQFTTIPNLTAVAPAIVTPAPANGTTGVPANAVFELQFTKPINAASLTSGTAASFNNSCVASTSSVVLCSSGSGSHTPIAATVTLPEPNVIRLTPNSNLAAGGYFFVVNANIQDTNGLNLAFGTAYTYTVVSTTDTTQPAVISITPPTGSVGVSTAAQVYLHFSEPIDLNTVTTGVGGNITLMAGGQPVPASISFANLFGSPTNQDVILIPYAPWPDNTAITVTAASAIQDPAGNALQTTPAATSTFTTAAAAIFTNSSLFGPLPVSLSTAIPINTALYVTSSTAIDPTTITGILTLTDTTANTAAALGAPTLSSDGKTISVAPLANLNPSHNYSYSWNGSSIGLRDINANTVSGITGTFTTSSSAITTPPAIVSTNPPNAFTNTPTDVSPQILFSEPVQTNKTSGITLAAGSTQLNIISSFSNGNQTLSLILPSLLAPATVYTLTMAGVVDLAGNVMPTVTQTFTTGPLAVLKTPTPVITPAYASTGVSRTVTPTFVFSAPINPLTVTSANFPLALASNTSIKVPATVTLSADGLTVTITPAAALAANTSYYLLPGSATGSSITDQAGNTYGLAQILFTTGQ